MEIGVESASDRRKRSTGIPLLAIASLWLIGLVFTNPFGDFPLNDDWAYGLTVKRLLDTGDFRPVGWTSASLFTHVLWGSIFCIPNGFSFEALRFSSLTISLIGVLGAYVLIRELDGSRWLAVIIALTIAFNPIYYALSNTFMTDVSFTAITILAVLFLARSLKNDSDFDLLLGTAFTIAATLERQLGIAIPLAFTVSSIVKNGFTIRVIVRAAIPSLLCMGALLGFQYLLTATGRLPQMYNYQLQALTKPGMLLSLVRNAYIALLYLGWFSLPVLVIVFGYIWLGLKSKKATRLTLLITTSAALGLLSLTLWYEIQHLMPLSRNIINAAGIGPFTLRDAHILKAPVVAVLPTSFWLAVTALSLLGGALLLVVVGIVAIRLLPTFWPGYMSGNKAVVTFLFLSAAVYMIPILVLGFFDRYLVPAIPPLLAASVASLLLEDHAKPGGTGEWMLHVVASLLIGLFFVFSICSTRDYLTWNRTRWLALNDLMEGKHVSAEDIDGGFEFNGLHLYRRNYRPTSDKSWWWVNKDTFVVAFGAIPGYSVMREYKYRQWMPPHNGSILLLEKDPANRAHVQGIDPAE
jgi:hypothetical protein